MKLGNAIEEREAQLLSLGEGAEQATQRDALHSEIAHLRDQLATEEERREQWTVS